ncbi:MAG: rod shape-determining protein [Pyrinomonadaceae bacterium]|nr:rod shape-determining protein [Pyrinomonadaceae bacterium]MCX7639515.1 rod shape-determining protein [Pyrinomonadaceae bacterium]MDW8304434.1 rod shape-determining protein [Acidobacteriota bacterium]
MVNIRKFKNFITDSMAIDMGTASTIIAVKGRDIVIDEPSLVAVNEITGEIVAYGKEAADMQGRESRDIAVVAPLSRGVVADFERTKKMLGYFVEKAKSGGAQIVIEAVIGMPSEITPVEQRALLNAAEEANIGKVFMMEEGLAAAFGAGISPEDKRASAVVDIGASTTNIAIVAKGNIIHSRSERIGSQEINEAISTHIRRHRGLQIGEETTEKLKTEFATTFLPSDLSRSIVVRGRDVITGNPSAVEITIGELYPVVEAIVRRVALIVSDTLTELRPEVAADIHDRGILLTGGGALLQGIDQYLRERVNLPVLVADEPRYATVRGLLQMFDEPVLLERVTKREPDFLQNAEVPFEA